MSMYRMFFQAAVKVVQDYRDQYEADVKDWYENGEGADPDWRTESDDEGHVWRWNAGGLGHRYPRCIHGTDLTTDYDNICGGCEDPMTVLQEASYLARDWCAKWQARTTWINQKPGDMPIALMEALTEWAFDALSPLEVLYDKTK